jgi:hypothetical protein
MSAGGVASGISKFFQVARIYPYSIRAFEKEKSDGMLKNRQKIEIFP